MREIKFRAWDDKNKEWLLGYNYPNLGGFSMFGECVLMEQWSGVATSFMFEKDGKKLSDLKLMQFTGLKDKNNKESYYGDIIEFQNTEGHRFVKKLFFCNKTQSTMVGENWTYNDLCNSGFIQPSVLEFEIIGNIYENPDLLPT